MSLGIEQVANELGALAKRIYDTGVIDTEQRLTITYDELPTKNWNIRGDGWYGDAHLIRSYTYKFEDLIRTEKKNLNQSCYIGPTQIRTSITAIVVPTTTFTVASTQYLHVGMQIDFYDATGTVLQQSNVQITNINGLTNTVNPAVNAPVAAGSLIFLHEE